MSNQLVILGCGNGHGVPVIGNEWGACDPNEPKNRRMRPAALIQKNNKNLLIDFGPDISHQLTRENISDIHGIIITHCHGDHINGIDDIRVLAHRMERPIDLYAVSDDIDIITDRFPYVFGLIERTDLYPPIAQWNEMQVTAPYKQQSIAGLDGITLLRQDHGTCDSLGIRIGDVAYCTDMKRLDDAAINALKGIKIWVVDGGGYHYKDNPVHACIDEVISYNDKIGADMVYLTHLPRNMDYQTLCKELPEGYAPAYDGLKIDL